MFGGATYSPEKDKTRLQAQLAAVKEQMLDGCWHTLFELQQVLSKKGVNAALTGVSARVRDLRKERFGGYQVDRRRVSAGTWEYRLTERGANG